VGESATGRRAWGCMTSTYFFSHLKTCFLAEIQNKMCLNVPLFWKKAVKIAAGLGDPLSIPLGLRRLGALPQPDSLVVTLANCYNTLPSACLVLNAFYYGRKRNKM